MTVVPGLDLERLRGFLDEHCPGMVGGELRARLIGGGKSNLTYELSDGECIWVVRRPPLGHVLATAHDMSREFCVMTALRDTDVPVPRTYALCEDAAVIGAPFYVMEKVEGRAYRRASELERLGAGRVEGLCSRMVDTLATLHDISPSSVGLDGLGRPAGFLERQVRRWKKQLDASRSRELPGAEELYDALLANIPDASVCSLIHGDYRLDNLLIDERDEVSAVLDWEMSTLGDPLTDVALLMVYVRMAELDGGGVVVSDAPGAPGFPSIAQILERYASASRREPEAMGFYLGLAFFKIAAVLEGIHYRYMQGLTVGEGFETVGSMVEPLLEAGLVSVRSW